MHVQSKISKTHPSAPAEIHELLGVGLNQGQNRMRNQLSGEAGQGKGDIDVTSNKLAHL